MVSSQQEEVLRVLDLVAEEEADCLDWLLSAVDVVAKEQVVGFGREATIFEYSKEIIVLAMDITYIKAG